MRIFIAVSMPLGLDMEWQVEVDIGTCKVRIHRHGRQVATARYQAGIWHDLDPESTELRTVLVNAEEELKPFRGLLKQRCGEGGAAGA